MKHAAVCIFVLLLMPALLSCVRYYKTSDAKKYFSNPAVEADKITGFAEKDYRERKAIYDAVIQHVPDVNLQPYPLLLKHLDEMKNSTSAMNNRKRFLAEIQNEFNRSLLGKSKILENSKEWKILHALKEKTDTQVALLKNDVSRYDTASKAFTFVANSHKISKINSSVIKKKLSDFNISVSKTSETAKAKIAEIKKQIDQYAAKGYDQAEIQRKKTILADMDTLLAQIENENRSMVEAAGNFAKEAGDNSEFWAGPGMVTHAILIDIENRGNQISNLGNRVSAKVSEFNAKPEKKKK